MKIKVYYVFETFTKNKQTGKNQSTLYIRSDSGYYAFVGEYEINYYKGKVLTPTELFFDSIVFDCEIDTDLCPDCVNWRKINKNVFDREFICPKRLIMKKNR
jgi:hypothetical protein